jgi:hypothetical protein
MRPRALAVLRLRMNSNCVGSTTGRSAGFGTPQNLVNLNCCIAVQTLRIGAIAHQAARVHEITHWIHRG